MTIWILALVLFVGVGYAGSCLGAIRAAFSFVGLLFATCLAFPLGHLLNPLVTLVGFKSPIYAWTVGPIIVFFVILAAFKLGGMFVHRKVDVFFKYQAGDLRMGLWNRLSARLGICVGIANATIYLVLTCMVLYVLSYPTTQLESGENASWEVKTLNLLGGHVASTGMVNAVGGIDPMPDAYYDSVDLVGLIFHNDLLEARLARYPAFLALAERREFQDIANDKDFTELREKRTSFADILNYPKTQVIMNNPDLLREIWGITIPNLKDLNEFLRTGRSAKYDGERILGRWTFDMAGALSMIKRAKPEITSTELTRLRRQMTATCGKMTLTAAPEPGKEVFLKNCGTLIPANRPQTPPTVEMHNFQGQWSANGAQYQITISGKPELQGDVEGDKLSITGDELPMRFTRVL